MPLLSAGIALPFFLGLRLSAFAPSEGCVCFPIHLIGVPWPWLVPLRWVPWVIPLLFLGSSSEVVIQATSHLDEGIPRVREFLDGHGVLNLCFESLVELGHLGTVVPRDPGGVLGEARQVFWNRARLLGFH